MTDGNAKLPAVRANPVTGETKREIWARWSHERQTRELQEQMRVEAKAREEADRPIHPRELAAKIAGEMGDHAPDWRAYRPQLGLYWGQLLRAQPECNPKIIQQRDSLITAVLNASPAHIRPIVAELRELLNLALVGHECAAFAIAWEAGRFFERQQIAVGAPGPPTAAALEERRVRTKSEVAAIVRRLRDTGDALDCDVEVRLTPRPRSSCTVVRRPSADTRLRLHLCEEK